MTAMIFVGSRATKWFSALSSFASVLSVVSVATKAATFFGNTRNVNNLWCKFYHYRHIFISLRNGKTDKKPSHLQAQHMVDISYQRNYWKKKDSFNFLWLWGNKVKSMYFIPFDPTSNLKYNQTWKFGFCVSNWHIYFKVSEAKFYK